MDHTNIIIIGSSTGGPKALRELFDGMPTLSASIVLVQHMPSSVNASLARSMGQLTEMPVVVASDRSVLEPGSVYVAPSDFHLTLVGNKLIRLREGPKVNYVCPSIDVTMQSVRGRPGLGVAGVILTGLGQDGAQGIKHIKDIGGVTMVQDQASSTIAGMPLAACATGAVDLIDTPANIARKLIELYPQVPNVKAA